MEKLIVVLAISFIGSGWASPLYTITNLGSSDYYQTNALGINQQGQVTGTAWSATGSTAYLWSNGSIAELGYQSSSGGISDAGAVAGAFYTQIASATLWNNGDPKTLGAGDLYSAAYDVNTAGQAAGYSNPLNSNSQATLWSGDSATFLGEGVALSINDQGIATGYLNGNDPQAFIYRAGHLQMLPGYSVGQSINEAGVVAGGYGLFNKHAFTWDGTSFNDLGTLSTNVGGFGETYGFGINGQGNVVGSFINYFYNDPQNPSAGVHSSFYNGDSGAFLYDGTEMRDLLSLVDPNSGWRFSEARGINDSGQIIVNGIFNGRVSAALLTPVAAVPEPTTYTLLLTGFALVGVYSRRRRPQVKAL